VNLDTIYIGYSFIKIIGFVDLGSLGSANRA